jgi:four helix bundle protein
MDLVTAIYAVTIQLPSEERFGLVSQLRRAAVSIPSALAEGHARASTREFAHYVSIARGSLAELETQLLISRRLGFLQGDAVAALLAQCDEQSRLQNGLRKALEQRIADALRPRTLAPHPSPLAP